ncbi:hypothetical protein ACQWHW_24530, partial [Salmonella enterica subsp. enterica serovar Infantis]
AGEFPQVPPQFQTPHAPKKKIKPEILNAKKQQKTPPPGLPTQPQPTPHQKFKKIKSNYP